MVRPKFFGWVLLLAMSVVLSAVDARAQTPQKASEQAKQKAAPSVKPKLEPKAIAILKASSRRLAAARTMSFTAVVSYESPSRPGPPLIYSTKSEVTLQRPDKLRVLTLGDGPASEFYYDGKTMMAFAPAENLVATAAAPPTIDGALKAAYDTADIYFPYSDVMVADPYKDLAGGLELAFYIGQSHVVGGTTTDMVAYAGDNVFVQIWIGAKDKLPRRARAVYHNDPLQLRHQVDFTDWRLNEPVAATVFTNPRAATAKHIAFARPIPKAPPAPKPAAKGEPSKAQ
jgi:hypothetical protein